MCIGKYDVGAGSPYDPRRSRTCNGGGGGVIGMIEPPEAREPKDGDSVQFAIVFRSEQEKSYVLRATEMKFRPRM